MGGPLGPTAACWTVAVVGCLLVAATSLAPAAALLFTVCTPFENQQCARVEDATVTFYLRNHTASAGSQFYETKMTLASVVMGEPSRPKILKWTDCRSVSNSTNPVFNETIFACKALVRTRLSGAWGSLCLW